ncbi:Predicted integral membrane protein [Mycobacteroides abscessus subsp. abscessus]|nr:Predicted integral membrane protein [Mycobacteroides abscessus subsp. abscessus]HEO8420612.1 VanZ family protein [Yersinia enterocolitica]
MSRRQLVIDGLFLTSLLSIIYLTMFPNMYLGTGIAKGGHNFTPFLMIKEIFLDGSIFSSLVNNIGNIAMFIPFGLLYPLTFPNRSSFLSVLLTGAGLSCTIEIIQWFMENRWSDIDDLILNTIGTVLGYGIFWGFREIKKRISIFL